MDLIPKKLHEFPQMRTPSLATTGHLVITNTKVVASHVASSASWERDYVLLATAAVPAACMTPTHKTQSHHPETAV